MSDDKKISPEDRQLFRKAVSGSRRLVQDRIKPHKVRVKPIPQQRLLDEQQVLTDMLHDPPDFADMETGEELLFIRNGLQHNVARKLRRGQYRIDAELDLHRMTSTQARDAVSRFLSICQRQGHRCIRIIHGKGLSSFNKLPVLKGKLNYWLQQRDEVVAFCSARPRDGGTGAIYVLLKRAR